MFSNKIVCISESDIKEADSKVMVAILFNMGPVDQQWKKARRWTGCPNFNIDLYF